MEIVIAILGSGALSALISGIFGLIMARKSRQKEIEEDLNDIKRRLEIAEKDAIRTQLLVLIKDFPEEKTDIMRLGEHYFVKCTGNWVMSDIFLKYLRDNEIPIPGWFKGGT